MVPLVELHDPIIEKAGCRVFMLREDLRGDQEGGNKYFKLKYNLEYAVDKGFDAILSFGGVHSNHIAALAAAGNRVGLKTIGIIRSDEKLMTPTMTRAVANGMKLEFVGRQEYRRKEEPEFLSYLQSRFPKTFIIPEGGSNLLGIEGCKEILSDITVPFDIICTPVGTGATAAGILSMLKNEHMLFGFQVLKAEGYGKRNILGYLDQQSNDSLNVIEDYHFGGYAKYDQDLISFRKRFMEQFKIPLDYIYSSKMMYGIFDLLKKDMLKDKVIVAVHTGGLQGNEGFENAMR